MSEEYLCVCFFLHPQWSPPDVNVPAVCFVQHFRAMCSLVQLMCVSGASLCLYVKHEWLGLWIREQTEQRESNVPKYFHWTEDMYAPKDMLWCKRKTKKRAECCRNCVHLVVFQNSMESRSILFVVFREFVYFLSLQYVFCVHSGPASVSSRPCMFHKWHKRVH